MMKKKFVTTKQAIIMIIISFSITIFSGFLALCIMSTNNIVKLIIGLGLSGIAYLGFISVLLFSIATYLSTKKIN